LSSGKQNQISLVKVPVPTSYLCHFLQNTVQNFVVKFASNFFYLQLKTVYAIQNELKEETIQTVIAIKSLLKINLLPAVIFSSISTILYFSMVFQGHLPMPPFSGNYIIMPLGSP